MRKIKEFKETASELVAKIYEAGYRAGYQAKRREEEASPIKDETLPLPLYREDK